MNRGGRRGRGFGRRTVLQLDDKKDQGPYSSLVAPSLGLVAHYGASDDEAESDDDIPTPPNEPAKPVPVQFAQSEASLPAQIQDQVQNGHGRVAASNGPNMQRRGPNDIDSKVADFLAEISAIAPEDAVTGDENSQDLDGVPLDGVPLSTDTSSQPERRPAQSDSEEDSADEEAELAKLQPPAAPITRWMHCLDDATQCYYYWHTETNAVQWQIPSDYQQYLLRMKEFEEQLNAYKARKEQLETKAKKRRRKKEERAANRKKMRPSNGPLFGGGPIEPLAVYPPPGDSPEPEPVYGPAMPPEGLQQKEELTEAVTYGPQLPHELEGSEMRSLGSQPELNDHKPLIGPELPSRDPDGYSDDGDSKQKHADNSSKYKGMNFVAASTTDPDEEMTKPVLGPDLPPQLSPEQEKPEKLEQNRKHQRRRRHSSTSSSSGSSSSSSSSSSESDEEARQKSSKMEPPGKSVVEPKKERSPLPGGDDVDVDFDIEDFEDIDRQLELALERKKEVLKRLESDEEETVSKEDCRQRGEHKVKQEDIIVKMEEEFKYKRKLLEDDSPRSSPKKKKVPTATLR